jgi:hypothetical protein
VDVVYASGDLGVAGGGVESEEEEGCGNGGEQACHYYLRWLGVRESTSTRCCGRNNELRIPRGFYTYIYARYEARIDLSSTR